VDSPLATINPNIIGYVGGYYQWDNNWKFTGRIGVQSFAAPEPDAVPAIHAADRKARFGPYGRQGQPRVWRDGRDRTDAEARLRVDRPKRRSMWSGIRLKYLVNSPIRRKIPEHVYEFGHRKSRQHALHPQGGLYARLCNARIQPVFANSNGEQTAH
jgi:hypothetical protein